MLKTPQAVPAPLPAGSQTASLARSTSRSKIDQFPTADPVEDLRNGWDLHVGFGLANPAVFTLMYDGHRAGNSPPAATAAGEILAAHIHRIAEAGRLRVTEERAANLVQAAGRGTTLTLISMPEERRDLGLSDLPREAIIATISTDAPASPEPGPVGAAVTLRAVLPQTAALTAPEHALLQDWLGRIIDADVRESHQRQS